MPPNASQVRNVKALVVASLAMGLLTIGLPDLSTPKDPVVLMPDLVIEEVTRLRDYGPLSKRDLVRGPRGWQQASPWDASADTERIDEQIARLRGVVLDKIINVPNVEYDRHIVIEQMDGTQQEIQIGRRVPGSSGQYLKIGDTAWISATAIPLPLDDDAALDGRVLAFQRHAVRYLELGQTSLERTQSGWRTQTGTLAWDMAKQSEVQELIDALLDLRFESFSATKTPKTVFEVRIFGDDRELLGAAFVNPTEPWSARLTEGHWAPITPGLAPWMNHAFARHSVFDFDPSLAQRFSVRTGHSSIDLEDMNALIPRLLSISGLPSPGTTVSPEAVQLTAHLAGQNHTHAVRLWASAQDIFASHGEDFNPLKLDPRSAETIREILGPDLL